MDSGHPAQPPAEAAAPRSADVGPPRTITAAQLANAITQLRARRGQSAALQMQAVLRALGLIVVPDPVVPASRSESQPTPADVRHVRQQ